MLDSQFRRHVDSAEWPAELRPECQQQLSASLPSLPSASVSPQQHNQQLLPQPPHHHHQQQPHPQALRVSDIVAREAAIAYGKIRKHVRHTPLEFSPWLSGLADPGPGPTGGFCCCTALLKLESEQHTGSFKVRGALSKLLSLPAEAISRGVFTASTGNHALAVLHACAALSTAPAYAPLERHGGALLRPQLFVPVTASSYKVRKLQCLGADLHLHGTDCLQTELAARAAAAAAGAVYVSPYNDPWVMAGQGTVALELLVARRRGQLDVVLVPVGGGGLIGGVASVLKAADPAIRVIGCQPAASDVMARSVTAGAIVPEVEVDSDHGSGSEGTLSDATAGGVEYGSATLQPCTDCVDEWVAVSEGEIAEALVGLLEEQSKLVEGAAACALAAFKRLAPGLAGLSVVVVCCGGNIALPALRKAIDIARPPPQLPMTEAAAAAPALD